VQEDFRLIVDLVLVLAAAGGGPVGSAMPSTGFTGHLPVEWSWGQPTGTDKRVNSGRDYSFGVAFYYLSPGVEFSFAEIVQWISLGGGGLQSALTILVTTLVSV